jgi:transcriptional regulator with XRE-family HTH domain
MSFELKINPKDRVAGRFIGSVRKALLKAAITEKEHNGITQQSIAEKLGVNRSVINRLLRGDTNLTLRSVAEIAWALGFEPVFELHKIQPSSEKNISNSIYASSNSVSQKICEKQ